jgi:CDP-diacylglycerol--serine O-phosphatidyltransferase
MFLLPNLITLSSIFCGFDSIRTTALGSSPEDFYRAAVLLVFAIVFDMLDGRVARMTKTQSAFGLQIDSLADVISFAIAPALLLYKSTLYREPTLGLWAAFLFASMGAVRLARFNVLSMNEAGKPLKPGRYILGLPVPGAAGVVVALVLANHSVNGPLFEERFVQPLLTLTVALSLLMVSTIPFRSFKDLKLNRGGITTIAFVLGSSALVLVKTHPAFVLVWLIGVYILTGVVEAVFLLTRRPPLTKQERTSLPPSS